MEVSRDVFMHKDFPSLGCEIVLPNPLDHSHVSSLCSLPSPAPDCYVDVPIDKLMVFDATMDLGYEDNKFNMLGGSVDHYVSLGYFEGKDLSTDPYCVCLEDLPRKVIWTTFFNHSCNFSKTFSKVKRILIIFSVILVIASYLVFCGLRSLISSCVF